MATAKNKIEEVKKCMQQQKKKLCLALHCKPPSHSSVHLCIFVSYYFSTSTLPSGFDKPVAFKEKILPLVLSLQPRLGPFRLKSGEFVFWMLQVSEWCRFPISTFFARAGAKMWRQQTAGHWLGKGFDESWERVFPTSRIAILKYHTLKSKRKQLLHMWPTFCCFVWS